MVDISPGKFCIKIQISSGRSQRFSVRTKEIVSKANEAYSSLSTSLSALDLACHSNSYHRDIGKGIGQLRMRTDRDTRMCVPLVVACRRPL